jgi:hypothetical protein
VAIRHHDINYFSEEIGMERARKMGRVMAAGIDRRILNAIGHWRQVLEDRKAFYEFMKVIMDRKRVKLCRIVLIKFKGLFKRGRVHLRNHDVAR